MLSDRATMLTFVMSDPMSLRISSRQSKMLRFFNETINIFLRIKIGMMEMKRMKKKQN